MSDALFVRNEAEFIQLIGWNFRARAKYVGEQKIKRVDDRLLTAEIQMQRLLRSDRALNRGGHFAKHVNVRATKSVNRLFAIADDEHVRVPAQRQLSHQVALQPVSVLKFIDQKKSIAACNPRECLRMFVKQAQAAELQIIEVEHRKPLLLIIQASFDLLKQLQDSESIILCQQIESDGRNFAGEAIVSL